MAISTAKGLESNSAHSEFTAAPTTPVPLNPARAARAIPGRRGRTERAVTAKRRRRARVDWYALAVILLILVSGAVCIYRLAWAVQP